MNKQRLVNVLNDPNVISVNEIDELKELVKTHPYSQLLHTVIAKGGFVHATKDANALLHLAAMYATDRSVLKSLITEKGKRTDKTVNKKKPSLAKESTLRSSPQDIDTRSPLKQDESDALREEVMRNLELLMESKKPYSAEENISVSKVSSNKKKKKTAAVSDKTTKAKKTQQILESKISTPDLSSKSTPSKQIDIIEDFIKKEPSITKKIKEKKISNTSQLDLSEPSAKFGDDLISENLAQILTRQGKNGKAIDIYKKLIWKFPQKKAYFATQIEALKK